MLTLIKVIVPIALIVIGGVLLVVAIIRRRKPQSTPPSPAAANDGLQPEERPLAATTPGARR
jgi:cytochrome c-type biogenesis protein CcmH/NrfF